MAAAEMKKETEQKVSPEEKWIRSRMNPRLCFGNPDTFFLDLLMEEEEQG